MKSSDRPFVDREYHTADLPETPQRDFRIPASGWREAPKELLELGDELGEPVEYKRKIHGWLLWRAGPPIGEARYLAVSPDGVEMYRFDLHGKTGAGRGPDGVEHQRFRAWKESLRSHPRSPGAAS